MIALISQFIEAEWRIYATLNWVIISSDNGLSPVRRQVIIWTNAGILLIGPLGTNFSEILVGIQTFSFKKLHLKTSSTKWRLFCLGLNELSSVQHSYCTKCSYVVALRYVLAQFYPKVCFTCTRALPRDCTRGRETTIKDIEPSYYNSWCI